MMLAVVVVVRFTTMLAEVQVELKARDLEAPRLLSLQTHFSRTSERFHGLVVIRCGCLRQ